MRAPNNKHTQSREMARNGLVNAGPRTCWGGGLATGGGGRGVAAGRGGGGSETGPPGGGGREVLGAGADPAGNGPSIGFGMTASGSLRFSSSARCSAIAFTCTRPCHFSAQIAPSHDCCTTHKKSAVASLAYYSANCPSVLTSMFSCDNSITKSVVHHETKHFTGLPPTRTQTTLYLTQSPAQNKSFPKHVSH